MSGFGYGGSFSGGRGGTGICFVKSDEILNPDPTPKQHKSDLSPQTPSSLSNNPEMVCNPRDISYVGSSLDTTCNSNKDMENPFYKGKQLFVKSREKYSSINPGVLVRGQKGDYKMPGSVKLNQTIHRDTFSPVPPAEPLASKEDYLAAWKQEKDPVLAKFRKLAYEVVSLKTIRPNGKDKLHCAANRVPIQIEFNSEPVFGANKRNSFVCYVFMDGISVAAGYGLRIKDSKTNAYELALQKVFMLHLRIVQVNSTSRELQASNTPFKSPLPEPSSVPAISFPSGFNGKASGKNKEMPSQHKESNLEAAGLRRRWNEFKPLEDFVIVEPLIPIPDCTPAHTLRRSADFNHMLIEYEYFFNGNMPRCVLKIENQILADVCGPTKIAAKNVAATVGLKNLKKICWGIKTKNNRDSVTKINKEEMLNDLNDQTDVISQDNIGNKLLRKMGWSGGGVGKDGSGIAEPISLSSVLNREGLGLSAAQGINNDFRKRIREVIENYAASANQEDLLFSYDFSLDERKIIHNECRRLNLRSKSRGKGSNRYLCVARKRSVNQLFDHIMSCGGETPKYKLVPPDSDTHVMSSYEGVTNVGDGQQSFTAVPKRGNLVGHLKSAPVLSGPKPLMGRPVLSDPRYSKNSPSLNLGFGDSFMGDACYFEADSIPKSRSMDKFDRNSVLPPSSSLKGYERERPYNDARENSFNSLMYGDSGHNFNDYSYMRDEFKREWSQNAEDCEMDMLQYEMGYSQDLRSAGTFNNDREMHNMPWEKRAPYTNIPNEIHTNKRGDDWGRQQTKWCHPGNSLFPYNKY